MPSATYTTASTASSGAPIELRDVPFPALRRCELLVHTRLAGVCRTDLVALQAPMTEPRTVGHEILGTVVRGGEDVPAELLNKDVIVYPWIGCGACPPCEVGMGNACEGGPHRKWLGFELPGGFGEYVLVPHYCFAVSVTGIPPDLACTLPCSALTAYNAVQKLLPYLRPGHHLLVFGAGGVGLMVLQMARALTAATVICVDITEQRLELAREYGAHHAFLAEDAKLTSKIRKLTSGNGVEFCIDTVANANTFATVLNPAILRKMGRLLVVGLVPGAVSNVMNMFLPLMNWTIEGFCTGTLPDLRAVVALAREGKLRSTVTRRYRLAEAPQAIQDLKDGKVLGRAVIDYTPGQSKL
eukprot:TRINITY_DN27564_c0_g1_i1.p1 TRINITY_DN27564_c0_g1~~TRINITY_DN27564_c0_g1_i1.p1  ORF type:complete len:356 (+),score=41.95 TRINITY_DN27564_c0_g1_i1:28-1095(+)